MQDSIFTKIIKGEIPAHKIYEDDKTIAILDIHPKQPGHTLIVPKIQIDQLWDLDPIYYQAVMETSRKVALRIREVLRPARVGVIVEGVDVNHAHIHLIPFNTPEEFHAYRDMNVTADDKELAIMEDKLKLTDNKL
jgi:histidine triad (HIT) family protein